MDAASKARSTRAGDERLSRRDLREPEGEIPSGHPTAIVVGSESPHQMLPCREAERAELLALTVVVDAGQDQLVHVHAVDTVVSATNTWRAQECDR